MGILTPNKDSYPEQKRNGVGFSDKLPDWYGFAGSVCNFGAGYTGGVIQTCDDCQLRYGGPETTAAWKNEKPPSGAALGTGQQATIVEIEYQLPADFECAHAVFSWMWHTPHLCIPKELADKGAENDFWKFCNKNLEGFYPACQTEWQDEIFTNCMDAEVVGDGEAPMPSPPATLAPTPVSDPEPSPSLAPSPGPSPSPSSPPAMCVPIGQCGSFSWCDRDVCGDPRVLLHRCQHLGAILRQCGRPRVLPGADVQDNGFVRCGEGEAEETQFPW